MTALNSISNLDPSLLQLLRGFLQNEETTVPSGTTTPGGGETNGPPSGTGQGDTPPSQTTQLYRQRIYHLIPYGHFEEVLSLCEQLNALAVARGGTGGSLWIPTVGAENELVVEFEFDSLATFESGRAASNADPEWTALVRKISAGVVQGSVRTELYQIAPHLAQS
jgi:NIPSNAP protein